MGKVESESRNTTGGGKDQLTVAEAGRRGGTMTRDRHGVEFYRKIGARGGLTTKKRWGHLFSEFGKKGGRPRRPALESTRERGQ